MNIADFFTKALTEAPFRKFRAFLGLGMCLAFQFRLLHPNLATWGWPMNNEINETANFAFSLIWA